MLERERMICFIHPDVIRFMEVTGPTPEGDHLFFVDGVGRLRFRFVPLNREEVAGDDESPFPLHP